MAIWDPIVDTFSGDTVDAYKYDDKSGKRAIEGQARQAQQAANAQGYALAASAPGGGMGSPMALRTAQTQGAQAQQAIGQQSVIAQQQYSQQMEAMRGQAAMQASMANAQLDAQRDASLGGLMGAAAGALAASDPTVKQDISRFGGPDARAFEGSPRPAPIRADYGPALQAPFEREKAAALQPQAGDPPVYRTTEGPGDRFQYSGTGAGFGKDYGFSYGDVQQVMDSRPDGPVETAPAAGAAGDQWTSAGGRDWMNRDSADTSQQLPAEDSARAKAGSGLAQGITDAFGGLAKGMEVEYQSAGQYKPLNFGPPASDPRVKQDVRPYVGSGVEQKYGMQPVGSGVEQKHSVTPALSAAAAGGQTAAAAPSDMIANVGSYSYKYKPEFAAEEGQSAERTQIGPMANGGADSLEANPLFAGSVKRDERGLAKVDTSRAVLPLIAAEADTARRVKALESKLGGNAVAQPGAEALRRRDQPPAPVIDEQASASLRDSRLFRTPEGNPRQQVVYEAGPAEGRQREVLSRNPDPEREAAVRAQLEQRQMRGQNPRMRLDGTQAGGRSPFPFIDQVKDAAPDAPFNVPSPSQEDVRKYYGTPPAKPVSPKKLEALSAAVEAQGGATKPAAFKGAPGEGRRRAQLVPGGDTTESRPTEWNVPFESAGEYDPDAPLPPGFTKERVEDPDEPTRFSYRLRSDTEPFRTQLERPSARAERDFRREEGDTSPFYEEQISSDSFKDEYYETQLEDGSTRIDNVGDMLDVIAKGIGPKGAAKKQKPKMREKAIKRFADTMSGPNPVSVRYVADELNARGGKVTEREVADAIHGVDL
jgi:hypothetical protein